jgi:hypothetical protein
MANRDGHGSGIAAARAARASARNINPERSSSAARIGHAIAAKRTCAGS